MQGYGSWIVLLFLSFKLTRIEAKSKETKRCLFREDNSLPITEKEYCLITKADIILACPPDKIIVLMSLLLATKPINTGCMKRILTSKDAFCCNRDTTDVVYDAHCLQDVWNTEDEVHYQQFVNKTLDKCGKSSHCVMNSHLFENIQTAIPHTKTYSSYFQIRYRCISVPKDPVELCSSRSVNSKEIHVRANVDPKANKTCRCHMTSKNNSHVIIKAVDVRTTKSRLTLSSETKHVDIASGHTPLFGFREIYRERQLNISLKHRPLHSVGQTWLQISGSDGKDVNVICGEAVEQIQGTTTVPQPVAVFSSTSNQEIELLGYWPLIYVASGSIFTLVLVISIVGIILISRYRKKRSRRHHQCDHSFSPTVDLQQGHRWHHYATVTNDRHQINVQNATGLGTVPITDPCYVTHLSQNPTDMACDVNQLEAFLNCNEHDL